MNHRRWLYAWLSVGTLAIGIASVAYFLKSGFPSYKDSNMQSTITLLRLGDPNRSDLKGSGASIDNHPSGAIFYQREWARGDLGTIEYAQEKNSFIVPNVLGTIGFADKDLPQEGIYNWDISFGVSAEQADVHQIARDRVMAFLAELRNAGWKRFVPTHRPRLSGRQAWLYAASDSVDWTYSLDSTYTPTMDEWMQAKGQTPTWLFYANGVYLAFSFMESNMGGFVGKGTYLLDVNIQNEYAFYGLGYFPGDAEKIRNWKTLLPDELKKYHAMRLKTEAQLKAQGFAIDTTYQDPPIKALGISSAATP